jgi:hypothetical protein
MNDGPDRLLYSLLFIAWQARAGLECTVAKRAGVRPLVRMYYERVAQQSASQVQMLSILTFLMIS